MCSHVQCGKKTKTMCNDVEGWKLLASTDCLGRILLSKIPGSAPEISFQVNKAIMFHHNIKNFRTLSNILVLRCM